MDTVKVGKFISELRREKHLTQEQLGEKIGVTNKTISRWENGNYLPSIEMLEMLSKEFSVSINEILCGERIDESEYRKKADEIITDIAKSDVFSLEEKYKYWKKKWLKEHIFLIVMSVVLMLILIFLCVYMRWYIFVGFVPIVTYCFLNNRMMSYVEQNVYDIKQEE
ncbi:MAG: helix-turn-helix transcriptional regulator [Clostridia bacterium]|nr:helix-turn-helix transcriptional regulator [Clostridia bacterium]